MRLVEKTRELGTEPWNPSVLGDTWRLRIRAEQPAKESEDSVV